MFGDDIVFSWSLGYAMGGTFGGGGLRLLGGGLGLLGIVLWGIWGLAFVVVE